MLKRIFAVCIVLMSMILSLGCESKSAALPTSNIKSEPPMVSHTPESAPSPVTATPLPTAGVSEEKIGFVRKVYTENGINYVSIDYVDFYTGDAAVEKAKEHGDALQDEDGNWYLDDDGYYIVNDNTQLRTFPLSADCSIKVVDYSGSSIKLKATTFTKLKSTGLTFDSGEMLMNIRVENGVAKSLEQKYLP